MTEETPLPPGSDPKDSGRRRRQGEDGTAPSPLLRVGGSVLRVALAAASVVVLVASGVAWASYSNFTKNITHYNAIPTTTGANHKVVKHRDVDGKDQNILIIGDDSRIGLTKGQLSEIATTSDGNGINTDTMMIAHLPANGDAATIVSLPRDLWVHIPGFLPNRLNAAYADGSNGGTTAAARTAGFRLLIQTIRGVTGLWIDHYVEVSLYGFYTVSKAVGGVPVDLCTAVKDPDSGINLKAGRQTIEGTQALAFVRQRHGLVGGDLQRERRQQYFIGQLFKKVQSAGVLLNPVKLNHLLSSTGKSLTTDPALDPLQLANQMSGLTAGNLRFVQMPLADTGAVIDGKDVITYNPAQVRSFFASIDKSGSKSAKTSSNHSAPAGSSRTPAAHPRPTGVSAADPGCIH